MILFSAVLLAPLLLAAQDRLAISPAAAQQKFDRVFRYLNNIYVDEVDMAPLAEEAIRAMLAELDPHSAYLTAEEMKASAEIFDGEFSGELIHTSRYKYPQELAGKRVLVVGGGNSGCDIAVDAVHHAASVDISVRRGYHFVPKYIFGKPADTLNTGTPLPAPIKQFIDSRVLKAFTGDPTRFGFPEPDHKIYESHPVVNSLVLQHVGHGDITVRPDIERFDGNTVHFRAGRAGPGRTGAGGAGVGSSGEYDLVMLGTGYVLNYPFIDREYLDWSEGAAAPDLYLNIFPSARDDLAVLGMVEASGIGWQGRYEQADLVARYLSALRQGTAAGRDVVVVVDSSRRGPRPDLTGGYKYLGLDRMAYYVNKSAYRGAVTDLVARMDAAGRGRAQGEGHGA